jgi:hypothetical protein
MDENYQYKTEGKLTVTKIEAVIEELKSLGYKVTEEYSSNGQLSKVSGEHPQRKTRWDWLQLLLQILGVIAIPLAIFIGTTYFSTQQNQSSMQIALNQQRATILQTYIDNTCCSIIVWQGLIRTRMWPYLHERER